jgi:hypothetical protein
MPWLHQLICSAVAVHQQHPTHCPHSSSVLLLCGSTQAVPHVYCLQYTSTTPLLLCGSTPAVPLKWAVGCRAQSCTQSRHQGMCLQDMDALQVRSCVVRSEQGVAKKAGYKAKQSKAPPTLVLKGCACQVGARAVHVSRVWHGSTA